MKVGMIIIRSARGWIVVMRKKAGRSTEDGSVNAQFWSEKVLFLPMLLMAITIAIAFWFDDHLMS